MVGGGGGGGGGVSGEEYIVCEVGWNGEGNGDGERVI